MTDIVLNLKEVAAQGRTTEAARRPPRQGGRGQGHRGRHHARRRRRGPQPRPPHRDAVARAASCAWSCTVSIGPRLRAGRAQQDGDDAGRHDPDRRAVLADPQGQLHRHQRARRAADRLRQAHARGLDQRRGHAGRRGRLRGEDPQGAALDLHQLRGDGRAASRRTSREEPSQAQREPLPLGRRARALGPLGELPAERQHHATSASWCRRPSPRC